MKKLIIYFKDVSARIDSGMTLQVLNDYGSLSNLDNMIVLPISAKNSIEKKQIEDFIIERNFRNLHIIFLPSAHKIIKSLYLLCQLISIFYDDKHIKKIIVIREKKYLLPGRIFRFLFKAFLVTELHESCLPEKNNNKLRARYQKLFAKVNGILFTNQSQIEYLAHHKYDLLKYQIVLPNGVNVSAFSKARASSFKSKPIVLTYTGQFTSWKNIPLLFDALRYLPKYFHLRIAGGKENSALSNTYVNELISDFSLAGRVDYLGFIHPSEIIKKAIDGSAILLLPLGDSIIARYATSPMKLVEYMATPMPIVAVDAPSVRGLSKPESIFLAKSKAKDFAKVILNVYKIKPDLLKKRISRQNEISKHYDFNARAMKYNVWLNNLI